MRRIASLGMSFGLVAVGAFGAMAPSAAASTVKNVNFVGTWTVTPGYGFVITHENRKTGACRGTTDLAPDGYGFRACKVKGARYSFQVTYAGGYISYNSGVVKGNTLTGSFHDTNGSTGNYTGTRP